MKSANSSKRFLCFYLFISGIAHSGISSVYCLKTLPSVILKRSWGKIMLFAAFVLPYVRNYAKL